MSFETILRQIIREEMPGLIRAELQNMRGIEQGAEYLRTAGVAAMTGLTEKWILEVTRRGELKTYSTGKKGKKLYRRADVVAWLESLGSRRETKPLPAAQPAAVAKAQGDEKPRKRRSKLMIRENYETVNV